MTDIFEYLSNNAYPGRGIIIGQYQDKPVIAYFIMGRSVNSR
ncbi:MAG: inosine monophosphate cyclohydrolase, partial [Erysipelotrichaceae bacterium]|nr:inosine monophosphate cyclohydrolase [Erysipelotrichaceae bacterium]